MRGYERVARRDVERGDHLRQQLLDLRRRRRRHRQRQHNTIDRDDGRYHRKV